MKKKTPLIGYTLIFLGTAFLVADADALFNMYYLHYASIIVGIVILLIYYLTTRSEKNLLCRIGFHKFEHVGWDDKVTFRLIYRCQRCGYEKKVIRSSGGGV
ncbi:hypothetical protein [Oceanobacillus jeddahense]|uniref:Uncharacterized protein n=1 Tax=Oceanobacillus jeddahense TaxID=1462527 RepID=A0ABY5JRA4_9BACI|nr:hypothetical protein [Oceanobacillus jeddahense]UUI02852.1 hypothetical protein NP439_22930 [Oceanobacillus jeddahense]